MSLDLSPELENAVRERAAAEGLSIHDFLTRIFAPETTQKPPHTDPKEHVRAMLAKWQAQDNTPRLPRIQTRNGETPTQALFRKWEEEDAHMTEEERMRDEKFWEEFQQSIDAQRTKTGMRTIF